MRTATDAILRRLRELRERSGLTPAQLEERLILGPGWIERFEAGETLPGLDTLLAILSALGVRLDDLLKGLDLGPLIHNLNYSVYAIPDGEDLVIHFQYSQFDATYRLPHANLEEYEAVIKTLRDGLSRLARAAAVPTDDEPPEERAIKSDAVARAYLQAVRTWPRANPSDLWWFFIYRVFCEPYNHPARFARLDLPQSWKRTGGWALEEVFVRHYGDFLRAHGVQISIVTGAKKTHLVSQLRIADRVEADKIDVFLTGITGGTETCFGVVHVKTSFAERRTDDVPLSRALMASGYASILCTLDAKSLPSINPTNRGELGAVLSAGADLRSAKRKDIEEGYFSACFSYNRNTIPTPPGQKAAARIQVCDFTNPEDAFSRFVLAEWSRFSAR
jgi:transcriptional regulator with XRE-family HTH domain